MSLFVVFVVRILSHLNWIPVRIRWNRTRKLRIRTPSVQCNTKIYTALKKQDRKYCYVEKLLYVKINVFLKKTFLWKKNWIILRIVSKEIPWYDKQDLSCCGAKSSFLLRQRHDGSLRATVHRNCLSWSIYTGQFVYMLYMMLPVQGVFFCFITHFIHFR